MEFVNSLPTSFNVQYTIQVNKKAKTWQDGRFLIKEKKGSGTLPVSIISVETGSVVER